MAFSANSDSDQVLVEHNQFARTLILNRPKQLNALSSTMVSRLLELFVSYEEDPDVKLIILKGKGRAFCAGGDIAFVASESIKGNWIASTKFVRKVYTLNYLIATYKKPQVSILNGITMGAGAGASVHGSFRVATENTVFAMPENSLGLFPDVGASYYLSRLPGFLGEYVGLTGARLDGAEMLACGLATHFVNSKKLSLLEEALSKQSENDFANISKIIDKYAHKPEVKEKSVFMHLDIIDRCFSLKTVEEIVSALEKEATKRKDDWIQVSLQLLKKASPMSLKICLRVIREGRLHGVGQCLIFEYRVGYNVLKAHVSKDFYEGCRALLIDKDQNPKWKPSSLNQISEGMVDCYFSKLNDEGYEDLKLPHRPATLPASAIAKL